MITYLAVILNFGQSVILALLFDWEIYFTPLHLFKITLVLFIPQLLAYL